MAVEWQQVKYILRGHPPSTECEIIAGLMENGVEASHARQIKRNILEYGMGVVTLLPMWVITVPKNADNIAKITNFTGTLNSVVLIQDYKFYDRVVQCFKCFVHKAEFCHLKDWCVKCAGEHNTRLCTKDAAHTARFANCGGNYQNAQRHKDTRKGGAPREPPPSLKKQVSRTPLPESNSPSCPVDSDISNRLQSPVRVVEWKILERF